MFTTHGGFLNLPENLRISITSDHSVQSCDTCGRNIKPTYVERFGLFSLEEEDLSITFLDQSNNKLASVILTSLESQKSSVNLYPELFIDIDLCNKNIFELSNLKIYPKNRDSINLQLLKYILSYINSFCLINGYDEVYYIYDIRINPIFMKIGWPPKIVSKTQSPNGVFSLGSWQVSYMQKLLRCP